MRRTKRIRPMFFGLLAAVAWSVGCDETTGPSEVPSQLSEEVGFDQFENQLAAGSPMRVEIKLVPGASPEQARRVEIEEPEDLADREEVKSDITDLQVDAGACSGSLTVTISGIDVRFDETAQFKAGDGSFLTCSEFVAFVQDELTAGREPGIEAKRNPATENGSFAPQAPDDPLFQATRLELELPGDAELELNIDDDNLAGCDVFGADAPAGCLGALQVLGVSVAIILGQTEIRNDDRGDDEDDDEEDGENDDEDDNDDDGNDDDDGLIEFEGSVTGVDVAGRTFTLASGTIVSVSSDDVIDPLGDLFTLQSVSDAVTAGAAVRAEGDAVQDPAAAGRLRALNVKFEVDN